jgi:uncharacterized protein YjbJ (UPF0337 family)
MNWNMIEGKWKELAGSVKEKWGDMTDDEITQVEGSRDKLAGVIQQKYGVTQEAAGQQIDDWAGKLKDTVKD